MANYKMIFSPTGGTKRVADILARGMGGAWQEVDLTRTGVDMALTQQDVCLVAVPSFGGRVPGLAMERLRDIRGSGAKAVLVCVYGNRAYEDTLSELQDGLEGQGFVCAAAVAAIAEHSIMHTYAAGRPDPSDEQELGRFAGAIAEKLGTPLGALTLPGSHGTYKEHKGAGMKPEGDSRCISCGLCATSCPAQAIDAGDPRRTDKDKCIGCVRCVALCPTHARELDAATVAMLTERMAPVCGGRKENELFL